MYGKTANGIRAALTITRHILTHRDTGTRKQPERITL